MLKRKHKRGAAFRVGLVLLDSNEDPIDITGKTVTSQIRELSESETDAVDTLVVTVVSAASGSVEITRGATDTADWPLGRFRWDVRVTDDADEDDVDICETIELEIVSEVTRV